MTLPITSLYAGILALLFAALSLRIPKLRMKHKVGLGDGGVPELQRAVRVHANFAEYVPLALLLLLLMEAQGYSAWFLHIMGLMLVVGRGLHAYGLNQTAGPSPGRFIGTISTLFCIAAAGLLLILRAALSW